MKILEQLSELSHEFGTPDYVIGGGGNTSAKDANSLWIKPSGSSLKNMNPESFLEMDRSVIAKLYSNTPLENPHEREKMALKILAEAKRNPEDPKRPSVETPLHNAYNSTFIVHVHAPLVVGLVCAKNSKDACQRLFPKSLYVDYVDPGYMLSARTCEEIKSYRHEYACEPSAVFLENHGLVVAGDTMEKVRSTFAHIMSILKEEYRKAGIETEIKTDSPPPQDHVREITEQMRLAYGEEHASYVEASGPFAVARGPLTPDHIVYMGAYAFIGEPTADALQTFISKHGFAPRIVESKSGVISFGTTRNNARLALEIARNGALTIRLTQAFGGTRYMSREAWTFIDKWEAESYRRTIADK